MAMKTSQAINGFVSDDPRLTYNRDGQPRFYARIGIKHYERLGDGEFKRLPNSYHDLIQFGKSAELSYERFNKGDEFVAQGQTREYTRDVDGVSRTDEQFVATRISHDPNTTSYTVERRSRDSADRAGADRDSSDRDGSDRDGAGWDQDRQARLGPAQPVAQHTTPATEAVSR